MLFVMPIQGMAQASTPLQSSLDAMREGHLTAEPHSFAVGDTRGSASEFQRTLDAEASAVGVGTPSPSADDYGYVWSDLDGDGTDEVMLKPEDAASCGSIGCVGVVLRRQGQDWTVVGRLPFVRTIRVGSPVRGGYRTLYSMDACAVWDGRGYVTVGDDWQDGEDIHPHACGRNYEPELTEAIPTCHRCHGPGEAGRN